MTDVPGFLPLLAAPKSILGQTLHLMHWSGATDVDTFETVDDAKAAYMHGYYYYRAFHEDGEPS